MGTEVAAMQDRDTVRNCYNCVHIRFIGKEKQPYCDLSARLGCVFNELIEATRCADYEQGEIMGCESGGKHGNKTAAPVAKNQRVRAEV